MTRHRKIFDKITRSPKIIHLIILAVSLSVIFSLTVQAQQPEQLTVVDTAMNDHWQDIATWQRSYRDSRLTYYQMLWSHTAAPISATAPDNLNSHPENASNFNYSFWGDTQPATTTYRLKMDTYIAPTGQGFVVTYQTSDGERIWQKSVNYGPETNRTQDWFVVTITGTQVIS